MFKCVKNCDFEKIRLKPSKLQMTLASSRDVSRRDVNTYDLCRETRKLAKKKPCSEIMLRLYLSPVTLREDTDFD